MASSSSGSKVGFLGTTSWLVLLLAELLKLLDSELLALFELMSVGRGDGEGDSFKTLTSIEFEEDEISGDEAEVDEDDKGDGDGDGDGDEDEDEDEDGDGDDTLVGELTNLDEEGLGAGEEDVCDLGEVCECEEETKINLGDEI